MKFKCDGILSGGKNDRYGYSKPNPKSLRSKSEKKAGGQKGHKSSNLSVPENFLKALMPIYSTDRISAPFL